MNINSFPFFLFFFRSLLFEAVVINKIYSSELVQLLQCCLHVIVFAEFGCNICRKVLASPLTTPCAHNFCKACLEGAFSGQSYIRNRASQSGRALRTQKNIMKCPTCSTDIADYLQNPQVPLHIFLNRCL